MEKINISSSNRWSFHFRTNDEKIYGMKSCTCAYCDLSLDKPYSYIINCLKEANLLDKDYKQICCYCKVLETFGLLDLTDSLSTILYCKESDILKLSFTFNKEINGSIVKVDFCEIHFNIRDFSKVELF